MPRLLAILCGLASTLVAASAQLAPAVRAVKNPTSDETTTIGRFDDRLLPSTTKLETVGGHEQRLWDVEVPVGYVLMVSIIEKQGMAGVLVLESGEGREEAEADLGSRTPSARSLLIPAGTWKMRLRPANHATLDRVFELRVGELSPDDDQARVQINAEKAIGQGEQAYREKAPGYLDAALASYERSEVFWNQLKEKIRQADLLGHLGTVRYEQGEMTKALELFRRARDLWSETGDRAGIAAALQGLALVSIDTGRQEDAERWGTEALEIRRSLGDLRGQAETLFVIESLRIVAARHEEARVLCIEALDLADKAGDRVRTADALNFFGVLESEIAHFKEAAERYSAALTIDRDEHQPVRAAQALGNLGVVHSNLGEIRESTAYLEEALPTRKMLASPNAYATTLYNLAVNHADVGEYETASHELDEALALFQRTHYSRGQGFVLRAFGNLYLATGEEAKAERDFRLAAEQWREIHDKRGEVLALNSLGNVAERRRNFAKAGQLHRQALDIAHAAGYQREEEQSLGYLASIAHKTGDDHQAIEHASTELALARKIGDKLGESDALHRQGVAWHKLGDRAKAREALEQAAFLRQSAETSIPLAATLHELGRLERDDGSLQEAATTIAKSLAIIETVGATAGNRESRMRFRAEHRRSFDLAIDVAMRLGRTQEAFELSEKARAQGLVDMLREVRLDIRQGVDPALLQRERYIQELLDAKHERFLQLLAGPHGAEREAGLKQEIDALVGEYQTVEAEIREKSPAYSALMRPRPLSVADVQSRLLDAHTTLVEYWLGEERSFVWVVTRNNCRGFRLTEGNRIGTLGRQIHRALNARNQVLQESAEQRAERLHAADEQFARTAAELGGALFGPIQNVLTTRRLWIVSDGQLDYLPLEALPLPGGTEPLISAFEVARLPSVSVLSVVRQTSADRQSASRAVAVFADPVFRSDDERVVHRGNSVAQTKVESTGFSRLPFSRQEADAIVALAPDRHALEALDFDASVDEVKQSALADYRVVHFATHGLLDSSHPELSGLVLSMVDREGRPRDGFLRLHEIYNLKLNADVVALSACETALGLEVRGEGLVGLVRGFMYAGSPQILASLWNVRDRATAELMRRFYEGLFKRQLAPEAALRAAQLSMRKDPRWSQPYFWAAFTLHGAR